MGDFLVQGLSACESFFQLYGSEPLLRLSFAVAIGGMIGLDRAYRGRAAGFRTHILVCLASAVLMLLMDSPWRGIDAAYVEMIRVDPTRMAQAVSASASSVHAVAARQL